MSTPVALILAVVVMIFLAWLVVLAKDFIQGFKKEWKK